MNRLLLIIIVAVTVLTGCGSRNELQMFNGMKFKLVEGEQTSTITQEVLESYENHKHDSVSQIPMFRYIDNGDYQIYIGLPYQMNTREYIAHIAKKNLADAINTITDSTSYHYTEHQNNGVWMSKYIADYDNSPVYIIGTSKNKEVFDTMLTLEHITNRIILPAK